LKLLLDTHIWIWSVLEPKKLAPRLQNVLEDPANELWLSPVSVWEALLLHSRGRVYLSSHPTGWVTEAASFAHEAPLTREIAIAAHELPFEHRDTADRFLAATAGVLGLTLVTADQRLLGLGTIATLANR
jgi:PIN domain nuclease of toxin-antitoxin system